MTLYHSSNVVATEPRTDFSTRNLDFGKGFYTTSIKRWAKRKALLNNAKSGFVSVFEADFKGSFKV